MNPSEESPLWNEIKRLRRELTDLSDRHHAEFARISTRITALESQLGKADAEQHIVPTPPPLPEKRPAFMPALAEARLKPEPEHTQPKPVPEPPAQASPSLPLAPSPAPLPETPFELDFGKVWFVRIGIVILLTGLVFLGNYAYQNWIREMPNGVRLAALFACALALVETGRRLANKESLSRFGEVLLAGGMAFFYYCTFAAHHVARLRVIDSPAFGAVMLSAAALSIAAVSWLRQAKATAILGIVLASYATMLQPIGWMSCFSNLLLGGLGLFFMLRPGWSGPGWASMLGTYGAFLGWQLLGASGGNVRSDDPATLWFLPPVWVMFAIPGAVNRFRESLSDRACAWFTAANNALFFFLFSGVWLHQNGDDNYWKVAAVFGTILIALGILGRRQNATAGGVNIGQGIALATFAMILKLEGQNLALVLAFEALALAIAAWKYRGKCESVFSLLCGLGATGIILAHNDFSHFLHGHVPVPVWSAAITAALVVATSVITAKGSGDGSPFGKFMRVSACLLCVAAALIASHLCVSRLDDPWKLVTAIALSVALSLATLKLDPERLMPEVPWASLWFLTLAAYLGFAETLTWPLAFAAALSLVGTWLWHRPEEIDGPPYDLAANRGIPAYAFAFATPIFLSLACADIARIPELLGNQIAATLLVPIAILLRCKRLTLAAALYSLFSLAYLLIPPIGSAPVIFGTSSLAALSAGALLSPWGRRMGGERPGLAIIIFRLSAFISYCAAWHQAAPGAWTDFLAITCIILTAVSVIMKRKMFVECLGLIAIALAGLIGAMISTPWRVLADAADWRGVLVIIAMLALTLSYRHRPALIADPQARKSAIAALAAITCLITALWATQMLVWRFGWKPTAVLWTILGFAFVSAGLWQRLHIFRVSGFMLLLLSFGKLFAVDVWDFTAFMRVASFIVLGAALILLGLFYNKFAEAIKALLDDERGMGA
ncbi:DUF2339 domain-containing protein [Akkermansiaceae bacterium]|nr:DUF2339 domain-containing protein [Akkermansiaceae bacterium]